MGIKLRKKNSYVIIQFLFCCILFSLFGCKYDPETMIPMSSEEICNYMKSHFEGDFEIVYNKIEDSNVEKSNSVYMRCSLFPGRTVITKHGYSDSIFGWGSIFVTNYNELYFRDDIERAYGELIKGWFGAFEMKYVLSSSDNLTDVANYKTFTDYLQTSPYISYNVVLNIIDEEVKENAILKAKSVYFDIRNKREYPLHLNLYLWEDDNFNTLNDDTIRAFVNSLDKYENQFYYKDEILENYGL